jgi:hypothetical protein
MKAMGYFLAAWLGWSFVFTVISLLMSGFAFLHYTVGVGLVMAIVAPLIDRWRKEKPWA